MSKCDLTIAMDRVDRRYRGGDVIAGFLRVRVNKDCTCKALTIAIEWRTHGRGNKTSGGREERTLFQGDWTAGKDHEYEWFFVVPEGPPTYHGKVLNVDWYVTARADIPWAIDPKADEEFLLEPGPDAWIAPPDPMQALPQVTRNIMKGEIGGPALGCLVLFLLPFFAVGFGALGGGVIALLGGGGWEGMPAGLFMIPFGLIFLAAPSFILYRVLRNRIAARKMGPVEVTVDPLDALPGTDVACRVAFTPTVAMELAGVRAVLIGREQVVSGSGTNQTTHRHELHRAEVRLSGPKSLPAGRRVEVDGTLAIPADAAPSFRAPSNALHWIVETKVEVPRWPDWEDTTELTVRPAPAEGDDSVGEEVTPV